MQEVEPLESLITIYNSDNAYYTDLIDYLKISNQMQDDDVTLVNDGYWEAKNTESINRILFYLPKEIKPDINKLFKLTTDKDLVQKSITKARKKKGEWSEFQMLYDLHPLMKYYMTQLEASVDKEVALVAKSKNFPKDTCWFVIEGSVYNNLGQTLISEFFVVSMVMGGGFLQKPIPLQEFIKEFKIDENIPTQNISKAELSILQELLPEIIDISQQMYLFPMQDKFKLDLEKDLKEYSKKLNDWVGTAEAQLEMQFENAPQTVFSQDRRKRSEIEIKTIKETYSQHYIDMTSLSNEAHLKVLAVFYNANR